jgi:regulator of RNase E activity RraA
MMCRDAATDEGHIGSAFQSDRGDLAIGDHGTGATPTDSRPQVGAIQDVLSDDTSSKLRSVSTASLSWQLRLRGLNNVVIQGLHSNQRSPHMVGVARTIRYVPNREDLVDTHGGGFNLQKQTFDSLRPGDVLVIEARGQSGAGSFGDILALRAQVLGAAGIVTDGAIRDSAGIHNLQIPTFFRTHHPSVLAQRFVPWERDVLVACADVAIQPGDIIVGDGDGVIVIPPSVANEVTEAAIQQEIEEGYVTDRVASGVRLEGLYPLSQTRREEFLAWADEHE